ncbi:mucin-5AC [Scaptodrosophila lebanonensis]|uniref:Mucin-5AC n=1 Tax=Drosophila lebanonensis TaxID=7225 RepID=A0A6J2U928_DROLE|nr:mucin-5AC [Scaptodrosophila lebanonensis]XP_030383681.1 mucin-5AC [Scaptodrosophila lebanonensis]XP_030383682.1 mucin-5AC [Scaptodrosophila lebanonensis]
MHRTTDNSQHPNWHVQLPSISNQQQDGQHTQLQMSSKKCNNKRRRRRGGGGGSTVNFVGHFANAWSVSLAILICIAQTTTTANAVPTDSSILASLPTVTAMPKDATVLLSSSTESLPEQQQPPQGQCLLDGIWVPETTVHCEKQASCRAIQRTGHCCPDYKCDCEKDGKTYANGYKLVDPDTPCTVCYCKGGEIVCSSVTCFRRDDCMPKYVAGRCCPEYDNCPILDNNPPLALDASSTTTSTAKPSAVAPPAGFNWNITIKEITKPTEIRITDENKSKPAIPMRKSATTESATTATGAAAVISSTTPATTTTATIATATSTQASTTTTTRVSTVQQATSTVAATTTAPAPAAAAAAAIVVGGTSATATTATPTTAVASTNTTLADSLDTNLKALPASSSNNNSSNGENLKLIASVGYIERPLVANVAKTKPLVTYKADGLQPLAENDPSKVNIKREYTTEGMLTESSTKAFDNGAAVGLAEEAAFVQTGFGEALLDSTQTELEPDTAGSDNIYHIISTTAGPASSGSTERQLSTDAPTTAATATTVGSTTRLELSTDAPASRVEVSTSPAMPLHLDVEDEVPQVESNPAYPSLPGDDFSLRDVNFPLVELEDIAEADTKDEPRTIIGAFELPKHNKRLPESTLDGSGAGSGGGSGDMELYSSTTMSSLTAAASSMQTKFVAIVPLMYSAEDSSVEVQRLQNASDAQLLDKISRKTGDNETSGEVSLEPESLEALLGSGSGSGELANSGSSTQRQREPTTPGPAHATSLDIDELGSGGGGGGGAIGADPKADAESVKLDESQEHGDNVAKTNTADKATTRAEKSFVERTGTRLERLYLQRVY